MRITCPNCTASFEIPTELLGKKGRSLKCASCGHSWYQTPHVETIDLAEIMGQEYAARAKAAMGPAASPAPAQPQARPPGAQAATPGQPARQPAAAGAAASPLGVSLLNRRINTPGQQPNQTAQSWLQQPGQPVQPGQPGAQPRPSPAGMTPGPGGPAPTWFQPQQAPPAPGMKPGPGSPPSWYQGDPAAQGGMQRPGAPAGPQAVSMRPPPGTPPGGLNVQAAAIGGQSMRGQAGAGVVGDASVSWVAQPGVAQAAVAAPMGGVGLLPGAPGGPTAVSMRAGTMMGQAGAAAVGDAALSWNQRGPVPPGGMAPPALGASMMGQAGAAAVGDASVSWVQNPGVAAPGAPGAPGMSQMTGAVHAPGQGTQSMMGQMQRGPGVGAMSQISGQIAAPGMGAHSMLAGTMRAPGQPGHALQQPGMPGGPGVSQMGAPGMPGMPGMSQMPAPGAPGLPPMGRAGMPVGPGAPQMGAAAMPGAPGMPLQMAPPVAGAVLSGTMQAAAPGAPGMSMAAAAVPGASMAAAATPAALGTSAAAAAAPNAAGQTMAAVTAGTAAPVATLAAAASVPPAPGAALKAEAATRAEASILAADKKAAGAEAALLAGEAPAKDEDAEGASEEDKATLWSGAKEDEELVDPDADRPDFGGAEQEEAVAEDEEDGDEDEEAEAGKAKPPFTIKPERSIDPAYITAGLMVVAVISLGAVLWSQRAQLSKMWPGFDAVYKKLGLEAKRPGQGLRIAQSGAPRLLRIGGIETLVVKGYVSNIDTQPRPVPHMKLQLLDATGAVVQESDTAPAKSALTPGESMDYEVKLELPNMAAAKSVAVNWAGE